MEISSFLLLNRMTLKTELQVCFENISLDLNLCYLQLQFAFSLCKTHFQFKIFQMKPFIVKGRPSFTAIKIEMANRCLFQSIEK